jgi:hypothetical protein
MSIDLSSWLWWRLVSLVVVVVMWLLLAFGVAATPAAQDATAATLQFEAARQPFASGPCGGRLETTACRFESVVVRPAVYRVEEAQR